LSLGHRFEISSSDIDGNSIEADLFSEERPIID
jgi:hypothetical protein